MNFDKVCLHKIVTDENNNPIDYIILDVNPSFEKILGLPKKDSIGKTATLLYQIEDPAPNQGKVEFVILDGRVAQYNSAAGDDLEIIATTGISMNY